MRKLDELTDKQKSLMDSLKEIGPILKGSIHIQKRKCGKPNCRCSKGKLHRAAYLVYRNRGKTERKYLGSTVPAKVRKYVNNYRKLKRNLEKLTEVTYKIIVEEKNQKRLDKLLMEIRKRLEKEDLGKIIEIHNEKKRDSK